MAFFSIAPSKSSKKGQIILVTTLEADVVPHQIRPATGPMKTCQGLGQDAYSRSNEGARAVSF